jgi:hypothetical protein
MPSTSGFSKVTHTKAQRHGPADLNRQNSDLPSLSPLSPSLLSELSKLIPVRNSRYYYLLR